MRGVNHKLLEAKYFTIHMLSINVTEQNWHVLVRTSAHSWRRLPIASARMYTMLAIMPSVLFWHSVPHKSAQFLSIAITYHSPWHFFPFNLALFSSRFLCSIFSSCFFVTYLLRIFFLIPIYPSINVLLKPFTHVELNLSLCMSHIKRAPNSTRK